MQLPEIQKLNEMAKQAAENPVIDSVEGPITQDQLEEWLDEYEVAFDEYKIENGRVDIMVDFSLDDEPISQIPVPLGKIDGDFNASVKPLSTFNNFPTDVAESFFCYDTQVSSFEGLNIRCGGAVDLSMNTKLQDFRGIHRHIRQMNGVFKFDLEYVHAGGMGIMLIDGVKKIDCGDKNVNDIFNKYLKKGQFFEAQEHLIDGGYAYLARV